MKQNEENSQKAQELTKEELEQRVKSRMQFELFRAKEVKSKAQSEQTTSERQETASLTI